MMRVSRQARELSIVTLFGNNVDGIGNVDNGLERSGTIAWSLTLQSRKLCL